MRTRNEGFWCLQMRNTIVNDKYRRFPSDILNHTIDRKCQWPN